MVSIPQPLRKEWLPLYRAADEFRKQASWRWMRDSQTFGVMNPENSEVAHCCVLGMAGEVFGLAAYLGKEGLNVYRQVQCGELDPSTPELMMLQNCLLFNLSDRQELEKEDLKIIRDLGLKFRGRGAWPLFRSYRPNYAPWFLESWEVRFLTAILEQSRIVAARVESDPDLLTSPEENLIFSRVAVSGPSGLAWEDRWLEVESFVPEPPLPLAVNEVRLQGVRERARFCESHWEMDLSVMPGMIMDRQRPYFPRNLLGVDRETGIVVMAEVLEPWKYHETLFDKILEVMEEHLAIPRTVYLRRPRLAQQLRDPLKKLGIQMRLESSLPVLEEVESSLLDLLGRG